MVVLVDVGSASAAEIIAGALQDHDRALVVGAPTFGKGLVQSVFRIEPGTALKLTTARWYTPSGRTIQRMATDERDQVMQAMLAADNGGVVPDSVLKAKGDSNKLPEFKTDDGRTVIGGGGIVPDLIIRQDTMTTPEREFAKALGAKVPAYYDVLTAYALELKNAGTVTSPAFTVTPAMRAEVYRRLEAKGVLHVAVGVRWWQHPRQRPAGVRHRPVRLRTPGGVPPPRRRRPTAPDGDRAAGEGHDAAGASRAGGRRTARSGQALAS